jgi:hypothetical protein
MEKFRRSLWSTVGSHVSEQHRLRVQRLSLDDDDLSLYCVFCGRHLVAGSPKLVNELAELLIQRGYKVTKFNTASSSVRLH